MPGLTVTEKEHWKERISRRIDKRIEAIHASDPNMKERVDREARERALASLGLSELQSEADDVERQEKHLEERGKQVEKAMLARVPGALQRALAEIKTVGLLWGPIQQSPRAGR